MRNAGLGFLPGNNHSRAWELSAYGSVVVCDSATLAPASKPFAGQQAGEWWRWRWLGLVMSTEVALGGERGWLRSWWARAHPAISARTRPSAGPRPGHCLTGHLSGGTASFASAANADGPAAVGGSNVNSGAEYQAMRWTAASACSDSQDPHRRRLLTPGWELNVANSVSADGTVIVELVLIPTEDEWPDRANSSKRIRVAPSRRGRSHLGSLIWGGTGHESSIVSPAILRVEVIISARRLSASSRMARAKRHCSRKVPAHRVFRQQHLQRPTTINGGVLNVTGSIASSSLTTVNSRRHARRQRHRRQHHHQRRNVARQRHPGPS